MDKRFKTAPTNEERRIAHQEMLDELATGTLSIGEAVRRIRMASFMTIREYAAMAGVNFRYLGDIERGLQNPSLEILERIGRPAGLQVGFLAKPTKARRSAGAARDADKPSVAS